MFRLLPRVLSRVRHRAVRRGVRRGLGRLEGRVVRPADLRRPDRGGRVVLVPLGGPATLGQVAGADTDGRADQGITHQARAAAPARPLVDLVAQLLRVLLVLLRGLLRLPTAHIARLPDVAGGRVDHRRQCREGTVPAAGRGALGPHGGRLHLVDRRLQLRHDGRAGLLSCDRRRTLEVVDTLAELVLHPSASASAAHRCEHQCPPPVVLSHVIVPSPGTPAWPDLTHGGGSEWQNELSHRPFEVRQGRPRHRQEYPWPRSFTPPCTPITARSGSSCSPTTPRRPCATSWSSRRAARTTSTRVPGNRATARRTTTAPSRTGSSPVS